MMDRQSVLNIMQGQYDVAQVAEVLLESGGHQAEAMAQLIGTLSEGQKELLQTLLEQSSVIQEGARELQQARQEAYRREAVRRTRRGRVVGWGRPPDPEEPSAEAQSFQAALEEMLQLERHQQSQLLCTMREVSRIQEDLVGTLARQLIATLAPPPRPAAPQVPPDFRNGFPWEEPDEEPFVDTGFEGAARMGRVT